MKPNVSQAGAALIVAMIMLLVMMILAVTSINIGKSNLAVVGNMQQRDQVVNAANAAIEDAISTTRMFQSPNAIYLLPCTVLNTRCIDINGDGTNDIQVALTPPPSCVQAQVIAVSRLNLANAASRVCTVSSGPESAGIEGGPGTNSLCSFVLFDVTAVATDLVTAASVTVNEGVNVQITTNSVAATCP